MCDAFSTGALHIDIFYATQTLLTSHNLQWNHVAQIMLKKNKNSTWNLVANGLLNIFFPFGGKMISVVPDISRTSQIEGVQ